MYRTDLGASPVTDAIEEAKTVLREAQENAKAKAVMAEQARRDAMPEEARLALVQAEAGITSVTEDPLAGLRGSVTYVMDAAIPDYYTAPKLRTDIPEIDKRFHGGLLPGLSIIAGAENKGKTPFLSQIAVIAMLDDKARMEQGEAPYSKGILFYSGEMSDGDVKSTMVRQAGDPAMINEIRRENALYPEYHVDPAEEDRIAQMSRNYFRGYRPPDGEFAWKMTIADFEKAADAGYKIFIIDNLLCLTNAMLTDPVYGRTDDNCRQSVAADFLAGFAARHSCWVILVAHTRKETQAAPQNRNDMISGSSGPKNLATQILFYDDVPTYKIPRAGTFSDPRYTETERVVRLTKNRHFGHLLDSGVVTTFDFMTKRIKQVELYTPPDKLTAAADSPDGKASGNKRK